MERTPVGPHPVNVGLQDGVDGENPRIVYLNAWIVGLTNIFYFHYGKKEV